MKQGLIDEEGDDAGIGGASTSKLEVEAHQERLYGIPPPLSSEEEAGRRVLHPQREEPVTVHLTPSDWRAWRNMISELRKRGFVWPPKDRRRGRR